MLEALVDSAYEYAFPYVAIARTRYRAVQDLLNPLRHEPNTVQHLRALSDHRSRWITAPNNDTLYSNAWLDLSAGPVAIAVAAQPAGRYWSLAFMDAAGNHIAMAGQRLDGCGPVALTVVGPDASRVGPASAATARAPTTGPTTTRASGPDVEPATDANQAACASPRTVCASGQDVWLFCRWLVDGPDDLQAARAMQDRFSLRGPAGFVATPRVAPLDTDEPASFLAVANEALMRNPPPADEEPLLARWAAVGLRPGAIDAWRTLPEAVRRTWQARIGGLAAQLRQAGQRGRRDFQGWIAAAADIGNYGRNHALRASVALGGLGALEPAEAMYFVRYADDDDTPLQGSRRYHLHVPARGIPTDSFWSLTMYEPTADGRRFFVENPIGRYSVGNRTPGLQHGADGSLVILLQHDAPPPERQSNWLPAPRGAFQIALRAYLPRTELRAGRAPMPAIVRLPD